MSRGLRGLSVEEKQSTTVRNAICIGTENGVDVTEPMTEDRARQWVRERAPITVSDLIERCFQVHPNDRDAKLRVVFHGWDQQSFNLPVVAIQEGPNRDFQFIVEEPRND